jgi:autotransporter-associated beta strand protein
VYVGSGGFVKNSVAANTFVVNLSAGTLGAKGDWSTTNNVPFAITGTTAIFKAADAADVAHNITLNGPVTGAGTINKTGGGILGLYGANTYTGPTIVSAGTLQGKGSSLRGAITNNAAVRFDEPAGTSAFGGSIGGSGSVGKIGVGTTVLSGAGMTYTGATSINQGVLSFSGVHSTTSGVTVNNGGGVGVAGASGATIPTLTLGASSGDALTFSANDGTGLHTLTVATSNGLVANGLTTVNVGTAAPRLRNVYPDRLQRRDRRRRIQPEHVHARCLAAAHRRVPGEQRR